MNKVMAERYGVRSYLRSWKAVKERLLSFSFYLWDTEDLLIAQVYMFLYPRKFWILVFQTPPVSQIKNNKKKKLKNQTNKNTNKQNKTKKKHKKERNNKIQTIKLMGGLGVIRGTLLYTLLQPTQNLSVIPAWCFLLQRVHTVNSSSSDKERYRCEECSCTFKKLGSLNAHISRAHSESSVSLSKLYYFRVFGGFVFWFCWCFG
jgi:hypothetical protein